MVHSSPRTRAQNFFIGYFHGFFTFCLRVHFLGWGAEQSCILFSSRNPLWHKMLVVRAACPSSAKLLVLSMHFVSSLPVIAIFLTRNYCFLLLGFDDKLRSMLSFCTFLDPLLPILLWSFLNRHLSVLRISFFASALFSWVNVTVTSTVIILWEPPDIYLLPGWLASTVPLSYWWTSSRMIRSSKTPSHSEDDRLQSVKAMNIYPRSFDSR